MTQVRVPNCLGGTLGHMRAGMSLSSHCPGGQEGCGMGWDKPRMGGTGCEEPSTAPSAAAKALRAADRRKP